MRQLKITKSITNRESPSFEKYLQEIGKEELITSEEEIALAVRIRQGDEIALDKLVRANLRFVVSVAKQYQNQGLSLPDLINEGNFGLIKAAKRFDETKGFKFISYAVWWIRQCILQALAEQSRIVRLPLNQIGAMNKINKAINTLEQKYQREPTDEELASITDTPAGTVASIRHLNFRDAVSIDKPTIHDEPASTLLELLPGDSQSTDEGLVSESLRMDINRSLNTLGEREAEVLEYYFGLNGKDPHSLEEIGEKMNLTRERIRQIKEKALRILKNRAKTKKLLKQYA